MRIVKTPSNEYYLMKNTGSNFIFSTRARPKGYNTGYLTIGGVCVPKELIGKRFRIRIEVV